MPELPEVEHFRRILLPLVGGGHVVLECPPPLPTKRFPSRRVVDMINRGRYAIEGVLRKGKVLCVVLTRKEEGRREDDGEGGGGRPSTAEESGGDDDAIPISGRETTIYLSLHMGMTGRISAPNRVPRLESLGHDDGYPPPHSHLVIRAANGMEVAFSDPRRFGSVLVNAGGAEDDDGWCRREECIPTFRDIAPDALSASYPYRFGGMSDPDSDRSTSIVQRFANRKKGIKGLLLDQRAVVSGIGNWVADELLYRSRIHPDQIYLNMTEARTLVSELHFVLSVAVACLDADDDFPCDWLFHRRWRNGGGGGGGNATARDIHGRTITFIQSGGRSTAIVPSIQKNAARMRSTLKTKSQLTRRSKRLST
jgi:formamidopyrimidine-DNA glycosylase